MLKCWNNTFVGDQELRSGGAREGKEFCSCGWDRVCEERGGRRLFLNTDLFFGEESGARWRGTIDWQVGLHFSVSASAFRALQELV